VGLHVGVTDGSVEGFEVVGLADGLKVGKIVG